MDELIKALRYCARFDHCTEQVSAECPLSSKWTDGVDCMNTLFCNAADAIERLQKRNEELQARWSAATIEGFPVKDLMLFAMTCRKNRVTERDLQAFAWNMEKALEIVRKEFDEALHRSMERTFQYGTELNDACRKQNREENQNDSIRPN